MSSVKCTARGTGDVAEAFNALDDSLVQFILIKFPVGSGTFKRNKFVYVHHIGPKCGIVKRGKWNAMAGDVIKLFGTKAGMEETKGKDALSFDVLVKKLQSVFVTDNGTFSVESLREEYNKRLEEEKEKMVQEEVPQQASFASAEPSSPIRVRKLASDLGLNADSVLKAVSEDLGPFNWCTFLPDTKKRELVEAGSNGLFELIDHLDEDKLLFGVVRLAFGTGRFRRVKRIFFMWAGDLIGAVAKAKAQGIRAEMHKLLMPCNAEITLNGADDLSMDGILSKVSALFVVDNINLPAGEQKKKISEEEYIQALQEEQKATSEFYNEPEEMNEAPASPASPAKPTDYDIHETIKLIHADEGGLSWGLFQFP